MSKNAFVSKDKLSKRQQQELNRQKRVLWQFSPVTRIRPDKTRYDRKKLRREDYDSGEAFSYQKWSPTYTRRLKNTFFTSFAPA